MTDERAALENWTSSAVLARTVQSGPVIQLAQASMTWRPAPFDRE
ncbi:hypothetical protein ACFVTY_01925 [Streptomyces sp. NPDC058067]